MSSYDGHFFNAMRTGSDRSAAVVVPHVMKLLRPKSVIDVGCGEGVWLTQFMACGVEDVMGLDGAYVRAEHLSIPQSKFLPCDLQAAWNVARRFDLAVCLEVGEHLDIGFADELVSRLVGLAPLCLFSAAIPHQGGTHHVNEQWPDYWAIRFVKHGFKVIDAFRNDLWAEPDVGYVYAQNMLLYVHPDLVSERPELRAREHKGPLAALAKVHPRKWMKTVERPSAAQRAVARAKRVARRLLPAS